MTTQPTERTLSDEIKVSVYWGMLIGTLTGLAAAVQNVFFANLFMQKGFSYIALEVFVERILFCALATFGVLFVLIPGVSLAGAIFGKVEKPRVARFALMIGGVAWILIGYQLNITSWFPPFFTAAGVVANIVYSIAFLGVIVAFYKMLLSFDMRLPSPLRGTLFRLYHGVVLAVFACFFAGFNAYALFTLASHRPSTPNLVIFTIDTLRADHLSCYGYPKETSPTIDRLAQEGVLFEQAYAQRGLTWPSLTSIMSALYPKTHGVRRNQVPLNPEVATLAEILQNQGYRTGAFLANYFFGSNRGFDVKKGGEIGDLDKQVTRSALDWLGDIDVEEDRFFLWLHQKSPHMPYEPPERFAMMFDSTYSGTMNGKWVKVDSIYLNQEDLSQRDFEYLTALYDAEIRYSDHHMQKVLTKLEKMGVMENTLIVFASDHGEELYEHNKYFYHSCSIYDGVLRVPLVFKFPGILPEGKVVNSQIETVDIVPTVLDLLKIPLRPEFEGRSLLPFLFGDGTDQWRQAFSERTSSIFATRTPKWKYIYNPDNYHPDCVSRRYSEGYPYFIDTEELYDVENDPAETRNLAGENPEIVRDLRAQLLQWVQTNKRVHKEVQLTEEATERLRALGYIK